MNNYKFFKLINILIIVPILLVLFSLFLATFIIDGNITTITYKHKDNYILLPQKGVIGNGQKIIGEFKAVDNNLGIILLPLQSLVLVNPMDEQQFIFKIKEQGSNYWISENKYKTNIFYKMNIFPFGFKSIANSKDKRYYFELDTNSKSNISPLFLGKDESYIATKYQYSKQEILRNFNTLLGFILIKIVYSLSFREVIYSFILYIFMPVLYLISIGMGVAIRKITLAIFFFPTLLYLIIFPIKSDLIILELVAIWIFLLYKFKLKSLYTFKIALFFIIITIIFLAGDREIIAEKSAELAYVFLLMGVINEIFLLQKKNYIAKMFKWSKKQK